MATIISPPALRGLGLGERLSNSGPFAVRFVLLTFASLYKFLFCIAGI
jgi:hypothetical protein